MTKICLIRHGQTDYNEKGKIQGRMDNVLNETGRKQAKKAALLIKNKKYEFDIFFSSSLLRAYETSKIIKKDLNFPNKIIKSDKFIERDFGELEGTTLSEQTYKELDKETAIGLESFNNLKKRAYKAIIETAKQNEGKSILITSHAQFIKALICAIDPTFDFKSLIKNSSLNHLIYQNNKLEIIKLNEV